MSRVHAIINRSMDLPEMVFKGAAAVIGGTTLWVVKTVMGHDTRIAVLTSQSEEIQRKLDKIIDLHLKANGNGGSK